MMKKLFIFISCLLFLSCNTNDDMDIAGEWGKYPWLQELIQKAKTDETGHYIGTIWLEQYQEKDYFVVDMMLGSGGIAYWVFDSSGRHFAPNGVEVCTACKFVGNKHFHTKDNELPLLHELKKDNIVYSSFIMCGNGK